MCYRQVCEKICADMPQCYSWAWAGNNKNCYYRTDCFWVTTTGLDPDRVSGYKGTSPPSPTHGLLTPTPPPLREEPHVR